MLHVGNISHTHPPNHMSNISRRSLRPPLQSRRSRLASLLVVAGLVAGLNPAGAQENVDIDDLRVQREEAREDELKARAAFDILDAEFEDVQAAFDAADELVALAETRADGIRQQLAMAELRLRRTEVGIGWAEYDRERLTDEITKLAVNEYIGITDAPNVLTEGDPTEALTRNAFIDAVQGASYDVIDTARTAQSRFGELREQAEAELAEVERLTDQLDEEVDELEAAREVRARARDALDGRRQVWLGRIDEIEAEEQDLTNQIVAEQRRRDATDALDAARSIEGYVWPTDGGIGSYFGNRVHPVLGYSRLHGGLDIGGRMGQPIWAAKEGTVILAGRKGGYGNTIVIDHGNGVATLYGHQSSFVISNGDYVETGQHIGNVGSTGLSTGPHLHFEVRIDGGVVDPLPYLPPR